MWEGWGEETRRLKPAKSERWCATGGAGRARGEGCGGEEGGGVITCTMARAKSGWLSACMVRRSEMGDSGAAWLRRHGLSVGFETLGLSSRVRRAVPRLQMQPAEPVVAGRGPTKTATSTLQAK